MPEYNNMKRVSTSLANQLYRRKCEDGREGVTRNNNGAVVQYRGWRLRGVCGGYRAPLLVLTLQWEDLERETCVRQSSDNDFTIEQHE